MAQLVASVYGVVLGGVAEVVGSNLARDKIFTASIGSVDSLYPSIYIYILYIYTKTTCLSYTNSKYFLINIFVVFSVVVLSYLFTPNNYLCKVL